MKLTVISDTHTKHKEITHLLNKEDVFIHAGDASNTRDPAINQHEMFDFLEWYQGLDANHKIYVPGNHDTSVEAGLIDSKDFPDIHFLINRSIVIDGVKFYGSPYTPSFGTGWAWNMERSRITYVWNAIPDDTDVLITHGPPKGILDLTTDKDDPKRLVNCGCKSLLNKVLDTPRIQAHIFGHVHDQEEATNNGIRTLNSVSSPKFVNASCMRLRTNEIVNGPIRFGVEGTHETLL